MFQTRQVEEMWPHATIRASAETDKICEAITSIQDKLGTVEKSAVNKHFKYAYSTLEDYNKAINSALLEASLFVIVSQGKPIRLDGPKRGVEVPMVVRLLHRSTQWIEIDCYGEGQDDGDKAIYKAVTGGRKYGLACLLGLSTTDDPERDEPRSKDGQQKKPAADVVPTHAGLTKNEWIEKIHQSETSDVLKNLYTAIYKSQLFKSDIDFQNQINTAKENRKKQLADMANETTKGEKDGSGESKDGQ